MNWLITGGCGFIGCRLLARLSAAGGHGLRVLDNLSAGSPDDLRAAGLGVEALEGRATPPRAGGPVQLVRGDIREPDDCLRAAAGMDVAVHLAANTGVMPSVEDPALDCETNVLGTVRVLEALRAHGVPRFVFASSGAPLGDQTPPIDEQKLPRPVSPYGASKLAGEAYCRVYAACFGLKTVALRFGNVYGPGSLHKGSVVAKFIRQALEGEPWTIFGDGEQTRDFIFVDDLVDAILLSAEVDQGGELFQVATGAETTVNAVAGLLSEALRARGIPVASGHAPARAGEVLRNYADVSKARDVLGWQARHSLQEGLQETVAWFLDNRQG